MSLFCPNLCISDVSSSAAPSRLIRISPHPFRLQAEGYARKQIARINEKPHFKKAQITWDLKLIVTSAKILFLSLIVMPDGFQQSKVNMLSVVAKNLLSSMY